MSILYKHPLNDLRGPVSYGGGGGGGGGGGSDYGASPGTTYGSHRDGGHMHDHGGIASAIGPAAAFAGGAATGGVGGAVAATAATIGNHISGD